MTTRDIDAVCDVIADFTIRDPTACILRKEAGSKMILALADKLPTTLQRIYLIDAWQARVGRL